MSNKSVLTIEEVIKVGYLHHIMGVEQMALAVAFSVNQGRIAEACIAMLYAAENVKELYQMAVASKKSNT